MRKTVLVSVVAAFMTVPAMAGTLEDIQGRGVVTCAVPANSPGIAEIADGRRSGLAIDLCAVLAAAVLGEAGAVAYLEVTDADAAIALQAEEADILFMPGPWQFSTEATDGILLVEPLLHRARDGWVLGPTARQGDDGWLVAVRWVLASLRQGPGTVPESVREEAVSGLGFKPGWAEKIASHSINYAAVTDRHMTALAADGWTVVSAPPGPRF